MAIIFTKLSSLRKLFYTAIQPAIISLPNLLSRKYKRKNKIAALRLKTTPIVYVYDIVPGFSQSRINYCAQLIFTNSLLESFEQFLYDQSACYQMSQSSVQTIINY